MKTRQEIREIVEKLKETTSYDINQIEIDATQKVYDKYNLPALFIEGEGEFYQGDATDEEVTEAARYINEVLGEPEIDVFYAEGHEWEGREDELIADELYSFLQKEYWEEYESELMRVVKNSWIEFYEEEIREFLNENYPSSGGQVGCDWSVYIDIETGECFEKREASSNWSFMHENDNRKLICYLNNYDKAFSDFTDYVAENSDYNINMLFDCEMPDELDYYEQIEWLRENAADAIEDYDNNARNEAIEDVYNLIADED